MIPFILSASIALISLSETAANSAPGPDTGTGRQHAALCSLSGEDANARFKTCHYVCEGGGSFSLTITAREICPFVLNR